MEAEWIVHGDPELSLKEGPKPTRNKKPVEPSNAGKETRVLPIPTRVGTFEVVVAACIEHVVIIFQKFSTIVTKPPRPPP